MFRANSFCEIQSSRGKTDVYGQPLLGEKVSEPCSVVFISEKSAKSSVRTDETPSGGNARERESDSNILLQADTKAKIDDAVHIRGFRLRILTMQTRYDVFGKADHVEITAKFWA